MRGIVRVEGTAVPFLSDYEINVHVTVVIFTTLIIAGVVFLVFSSVDTTKSFEPIITEQNSDTVLTNSGFDRNYCAGLLTAGALNATTSEYYVDYNIDGSFGNKVQWNTTSEPSVEFSLFEVPGVFYVDSINGFQGCGTNDNVAFGEKVSEITSSLNFSDCGSRNVSIVKSSLGLYSLFDVYSTGSGNGVEHVMIFAAQKYGKEDNIIKSLGCQA